MKILLHIHYLWYWLILVVLLATLLGGLIWAVSQKRRIEREEQVMLTAKAKESLALARQLVEEAALANNPNSTRSALLKWAECRWPGQVFLGLSNVADAVKDPALKEAIERLQRLLYTEEQLKWNGTDFWDIFNDAEPD